MIFAALLWDLDGTLIDSEPAHKLALDHALAELGLAVSDDFHARMLGVSDVGVHQALVAETGTSLAHSSWRALKLAHFRRNAAHIRRREGVASLAPHWAGRGIASAVVSNSTAEEMALGLEVTGLATAFRLTVSLADVTRGKPDPEGYLLAATRLGVAPTACLVIEDSAPGAAAGRAAGMSVVFHPQAPLAAATEVPAGAHYLPPTGSLAALLARAMTTGELT